MGRTKQISFKDTDVISASEIGQYHYCSMAWYLQKCGYEPKSPALDNGIKKHVQLGEIIDYTQTNIKKSKLLAVIGYLLLAIVILIVTFEVIL
jgi:hypothetical protein